MTDVTLLYVDGCPNWRATEHSLRGLQDELGFRLVRRQVSSAEEAAQVGFGGSPTVLVDGNDPFATGDQPDGLACRMYDTPEGLRGSPSLEQLRGVLD